MIRLAVAAILLAAAPAAAADRSFSVERFERLAVEGSAEVSVVTGKAATAHASGEAAALDRLDVRVEGDTLKIGTHRGLDWSWKDHGPVHVTITVPSLRAVAVAGSGSVTIDRVKAADFTAAITGSGSLDVAALDADRTTFNVSGSGTVTAAGRCGAGMAKIAGSGDLKIAALKCETLSASIAGSGSIAAYASKTATLATMGSGDIALTGGARCTTSTAGSGKVRCS